MKDHEIAEFVNTLTDIGRRFGQTQQLREHIAQAVLPVVRVQLNAKPFAAPGKWFPTTILGQPMREVTPGKWEYAQWPSEAEPHYTVKEVRDLIGRMEEVVGESLTGRLGTAQHHQEDRIKFNVMRDLRMAMDAHCEERKNQKPPRVAEG